MPYSSGSVHGLKSLHTPLFVPYLRRQMLHWRRLSRSYRFRNQSGHLREAENATKPSQKCRRYAIVGTWHRQYPNSHNVWEGRATWRQSRGPKRCRSATIYRLSWTFPSIELVTKYLRSTAIGYQRFRSDLPYRAYAGYTWVTLAKIAFRTESRTMTRFNPKRPKTAGMFIRYMCMCDDWCYTDE